MSWFCHSGQHVTFISWIWTLRIESSNKGRKRFISKSDEIFFPVKRVACQTLSLLLLKNFTREEVLPVFPVIGGYVLAVKH
jgi:hypothetical protein